MGFQFGIEHAFPEMIISYYVISTYFAYEICSFIFQNVKNFCPILNWRHPVQKQPFADFLQSRCTLFFKVDFFS